MNPTLAALLAVFGTWNPPATAHRVGAPGGRRVIGLAVAAVIGVVLAVLGDRLVDLLGVSAPTFRTAAGVVVAITGAVDLVRRPGNHGDDGRVQRGDRLADGLVAGLGPGPAFAATAAGVDAGWFIAALVVVAAAAVTVWWLTRSRGGTVSAWLIRSIGGVAVLAGVVMIIDGVSTV